MFRHLLPLVVLVALLSTHAQGAAAQAAGPRRRQSRPPAVIVNLNTASASDFEALPGIGRQDGGPDHRVPPEERAVQENRGADERPRHRREELSEAQAAADGRVGQGRSQQRQALVTRNAVDGSSSEQLDTRWWSSPWCLASRPRPRRPLFLGCSRDWTRRASPVRRATSPPGSTARASKPITRATEVAMRFTAHERRFHLRGLRRRQRERRSGPRHSSTTSTVSSTRRSCCPASSAAWTSGRCPDLPAIDAGSPAPGDDPIRFGASNMVSFSALGTSSSGHAVHPRPRRRPVRQSASSARPLAYGSYRFDSRSREWRPV